MIDDDDSDDTDSNDTDNDDNNDKDYNDTSKDTDIYPGTKESAVPFNTSFTWTATKDMLDDSLTGKYGLTVKKVKSLSFDDIEDLGFERPNDDDVSYALVTVEVDVKSAKLTKVNGDGEIYKSMIPLWFWGTKNKNGSSVIGVTDDSFDNSLRTIIRDLPGEAKLTAGNTTSFKVTGNIIISFIGDISENYLIVEDQNAKELGELKMYFKLK